MTGTDVLVKIKLGIAINGRRSVTLPERGWDNADYIDVSHPALDCDHQSKKQKPPLGQVTVSFSIKKNDSLG